jgi:hypothetical protein
VLLSKPRFYAGRRRSEFYRLLCGLNIVSISEKAGLLGTCEKRGMGIPEGSAAKASIGNADGSLIRRIRADVSGSSPRRN